MSINANIRDLIDKYTTIEVWGAGGTVRIVGDLDHLVSDITDYIGEKIDDAVEDNNWHRSIGDE